MRVILFTERNSPFGAAVMARLSEHHGVHELLIVTRDPARLCDYYLHDATSVSIPETAHRLGRSVLETDDINSPETAARLDAYKPDVIVLANYQLKVSSAITRIAKRISINFHPSPLPRYAGLAPFFWMARNGETDAGVSCCLVEDRIDAGALLHSVKISLTGRETSGEIREKLFLASFDQVTTVFDMLARGNITPKPQDLQARRYYGKPRDVDLLIDWHQSTEDVMRIIRAGAPLPGAITLLPNGKQVRIREAHALEAVPSPEPGTVSYHHGVPIIQTGNGAVRIISYSSYCPPTVEHLSLTPLRFNPSVPLPRPMVLTLLTPGAAI